MTSLKVGSYDIVIYNDLAGNATRKITVLERLTGNVNLVMDYVDGSSFNVKAIGNDGNPISGAVVKMSVNGVTYNIKTDKNGVAKLPIRLKPGKYAITCSYKGTTVKNTIKVKYTLKAQKKISVKKTSKKLILKATLKWSNGKAIVGKTLKFKFKGKTYKVKTNKKGVAKVIIKKKVIKSLKEEKPTRQESATKMKQLKQK